MGYVSLSPDHAPGLTSYHLEVVPQPPTSGFWKDQLRWLVAVIDDDDPDLAFVTGLLEQCIKFDGLTDRQGKYAEKIMARVMAQFDAGTLAFQRLIKAGA